MNEPKPVTIVSGFLGSGKTTLLNAILSDNHGIRFAVIVNEFGEIGLDASLIKASEDFVKMDNGCLCCVLNDELVNTIAKLTRRDDYDAVIIETTGIADPLPVAWTFLRPQFDGLFRLGGIVTVVDAHHYETMLNQAAETKLQIERADFIFLAKLDLCPKNRKDEICGQIQKINSHARFISHEDEDWLDLIFDVDVELKPSAALSHHHATSYQSVSLDLTGVETHLNAMEDFFETLPQEVFRAKAIFEDRTTHKIYVMHAVCGRVDFYELETKPKTLAAVFIGKGFNEKLIQSLKGIV